MRTTNKRYSPQPSTSKPDKSNEDSSYMMTSALSGGGDSMYSMSSALPAEHSSDDQTSSGGKRKCGETKERPSKKTRKGNVSRVSAMPKKGTQDIGSYKRASNGESSRKPKTCFVHFRYGKKRAAQEADASNADLAGEPSASTVTAGSEPEITQKERERRESVMQGILRYFLDESNVIWDVPYDGDDSGDFMMSGALLTGPAPTSGLDLQQGDSPNSPSSGESEVNEDSSGDEAGSSGSGHSDDGDNRGRGSRGQSPEYQETDEDHETGGDSPSEGEEGDSPSEREEGYSDYADSEPEDAESEAEDAESEAEDVEAETGDDESEAGDDESPTTLGASDSREEEHVWQASSTRKSSISEPSIPTSPILSTKQSQRSQAAMTSTPTRFSGPRPTEYTDKIMPTTLPDFGPSMSDASSQVDDSSEVGVEADNSAKRTEASSFASGASLECTSALDVDAEDLASYEMDDVVRFVGIPGIDRASHSTGQVVLKPRLSLDEMLENDRLLLQKEKELWTKMMGF
ncbi:hypothetical protein F4818DRAFT_442744 [Hypoxylon cercidicola]|nr:hypothetical protein F4818DRAFT_442744 [Hypoxylon cercidicola]